jgi:hypothetical protein
MMTDDSMGLYEPAYMRTFDQEAFDRTVDKKGIDPSDPDLVHVIAGMLQPFGEGNWEPFARDMLAALKRAADRAAENTEMEASQ